MVLQYSCSNCCYSVGPLIKLHDVIWWLEVLRPLVVQPLALVSWGCIYRMSWVDVPEAKLWIRQHALRAAHSKVTGDGQYDKGNTYSLVPRLVRGPGDEASTDTWNTQLLVNESD